MTIALVVNIPEGIILASDSQTTLNITVPIPCPEKGNVTYTHSTNKFEYSQKIFRLSSKESTFGILQFGVAHPGGRPLSNHIYTLRDVLQSSSIKSVDDCKAEIIEHFDKFDAQTIEGLGIYLVGYDIVDYEARFAGYRLVWQGKKCKKENISDSISQFGATWSGGGAWIITKLMNLQDDEGRVSPAVVPWQFLSLADGVELCNFLIRTVIGFEKFQSRFPSCGGKPQISVITPTEYVGVQNASEFTI